MIKKSAKIVNNRFIQRYIGKKLHSIMKSKKITMAVVSKKLGYSVPYLSGLVNGTNSTSKQEKFRQISEFIGLSEDELQKIFSDAKKAEFIETNGEILDNKELQNHKNIIEFLKISGFKKEDQIKDIFRYIDFKLEDYGIIKR